MCAKTKPEGSCWQLASRLTRILTLKINHSFHSFSHRKGRMPWKSKFPAMWTETSIIPLWGIPNLSKWCVVLCVCMSSVVVRLWPLVQVALFQSVCLSKPLPSDWALVFGERDKSSRHKFENSEQKQTVFKSRLEKLGKHWKILKAMKAVRFYRRFSSVGRTLSVFPCSGPFRMFRCPQRLAQTPSTVGGEADLGSNTKFGPLVLLLLIEKLKSGKNIWKNHNNKNTWKLYMKTVRVKLRKETTRTRRKLQMPLTWRGWRLRKLTRCCIAA